MANNVVEVTIQGVDDASKVFDSIDSQASKAMKSVEASIDSIPDIDIDMDSSSLDSVEGNIDEVEQKLKSIPDPDIDGSKAKQELEDIEDQANQTSDSVEGIDFGAIGGAVAGGATTSMLSDIEASASDLEAQFNLTRQEAEKFRGLGADVFSSGYANSIGEASKAVTILNRQTGEQGKGLQELTQDVFSVSDAYGADFLTIINAVRANSKTMGTTFNESLDLVSAGFHNGMQLSGDWLDVLTEFSPSFDRIGADGGEMISILQAGMGSGVRSIDVMADSINEFGILMQEADNESLENVAKSITDTEEEAQKLVETWQKDFAKGGDSASKVTEDVIKGLMDMDDNLARNEAGIGLFGTMWEDTSGTVGQAMLDAIGKSQDLEGATNQVEKQYNTAGETLKRFGRSMLGEVIGPLEEAGPALNLGLQGITGISTAILAMKGLGMGAIFKSLASGLSIASKATWAFTTALLANPITWIIASVVALIAVVVLLWKNWDSVSQFLVNSWNWIKEQATLIFTAIGTVIKVIWNGIKSAMMVVWQAIVAYFTFAFNVYKTLVMTVFTAIKTFFTTIWNGIKTVAITIWKSLSSALSSIVQGISNFFKTSFQFVQNLIENVWNGIRSTTTSVWNSIKNGISRAIRAVSSVVSSIFGSIKSTISNVWDSVLSVSSNVWYGIRNTVANVIGGMRSTISNVLSSVYSSVRNVFSRIRSSIVGTWNSIKSSTRSIWNSLSGMIKGAINGLIAPINSMLDRISDIEIRIPSVRIPLTDITLGGYSVGFGWVPNIPRLATGGVVDKPTVAMVGDAGAGNPEIVAPQKMLRQIIQQELKGVLSELIRAIKGNAIGGAPQALNLTLRLAGRDFEVFVDDITKIQERKTYRLRRS
ncbi:hypothetical protein ACTWP4_18625 [Gracilibacillus sp. D59]|uniref:hypothetical protein n=1 Tax=Gracilibacillus sp. D59 TaxID=3457434 RepID=UPI003FCE43E6